MHFKQNLHVIFLAELVDLRIAPFGLLEQCAVGDFAVIGLRADAHSADSGVRAGAHDAFGGRNIVALDVGTDGRDFYAAFVAEISVIPRVADKLVFLNQVLVGAPERGQPVPCVAHAFAVEYAPLDAGISKLSEQGSQFFAGPVRGNQREDTVFEHVHTSVFYRLSLCCAVFLRTTHSLNGGFMNACFSKILLIAASCDPII